MVLKVRCPCAEADKGAVLMSRVPGALKLAGAIVACAVVVACAARLRPARPTSRTAVLPTSVRVQVREGGRLVVRSVPIEDYVAGAAIAEFDPANGDADGVERMFEVQSIVARTYAAMHVGRHAAEGFDLCSTTHCQLFDPARLPHSKWSSAVDAAVRRTRGELLFFHDAPARVFFHADCGGRTSGADDVWGGAPVAYLHSVRDDGAARSAHADWHYTATREALRDALNDDRRTRVGASLDRIEVSARDAAGRATEVTLRGTRTVTVEGDLFRDVLSRRLGAKSIRSTLLTITGTVGGFSFAGRGFGHGVGLCQVGALARVTAGASPSAVLQFYFPGTRLEHLH
jgi:stage II sporulation protein D